MAPTPFSPLLVSNSIPLSSPLSLIRTHLSQPRFLAPGSVCHSSPTRLCNSALVEALSVHHPFHPTQPWQAPSHHSTFNFRVTFFTKYCWSSFVKIKFSPRRMSLPACIYQTPGCTYLFTHLRPGTVPGLLLSLFSHFPQYPMNSWFLIIGYICINPGIHRHDRQGEGIWKGWQTAAHRGRGSGAECR